MWNLNAELEILMEEYESRMDTKENNQNVENNSKPNEQALSKKKWTCADFQMGKQMGSGSFGVVYVAKEKRTGKIVAMKISFKANIAQEDLVHQVRREIEIHAHLNHPNILRMWGYFHDDLRVFMVLELARGGDLHKLMQKEPNKRFSEGKTVFCLVQLIEALKYIHERNVIHRDVQPENLLLGMNNVLKLADFGWAVHEPVPRSLTPRGTPRYMAPEMHLNQDHHKPVDLWATGVTVFELLAGYCPFGSASSGRELEKIIKVDFTFPTFVTAAARDFISQLIVREPDKRLTPERILKHDWITQHQKTFKII